VKFCGDGKSAGLIMMVCPGTGVPETRRDGIGG